MFVKDAVLFLRNLFSVQKTTKQEYIPHGGVCVECERYAPVLTEMGYCEACVMEARIQRETW